MRFLWLTLLASSSASSAYVQYASGASSLPPRYPLKARCYYKKSLFPCGKRQNKLLDDFFHDKFLFQSRRIKLKGLNLFFYITKQLICQDENNIQKNFR
jgi:hypothetical protein